MINKLTVGNIIELPNKIYSSIKSVRNQKIAFYPNNKLVFIILYTSLSLFLGLFSKKEII